MTQAVTLAGLASTNTLYADSSGNVGIGVSNPSSYGILTAYSASNPTLTIASGNANAYLRLNTTSDSNMYLTNTGGSMTMRTANTERMRIDSSGRVTTPYQPAFFAQLNNTTIYSTIGTIPFTRIGTNIGSCYNASTYRFTAPVAGTYAFYFKGFIESATRSSVNISVNGTSKQGIYGPQSQGDMLFGNLIVTLAANDYVTVDLRQGNVFGDGGGVNNDTASFSGYLLG